LPVPDSELRVFSLFDWPPWLHPPASRRARPPPRCPPQHPVRPLCRRNPRMHRHQPLQFFLSPLPPERTVLSTKRLNPTTYPVSNPIRITYARTCDVFFMHAMPPSGLGRRGQCGIARFANSHHTPPRCKPRELGIDCCQPRAEVHGSSRSGRSRRIVRSEDYGRVTSTRSCPGWAPRQIDASRRESWTCVCPWVRACDGSHSTARCCSRWSIEGLCESTRSTSKERAGSLSPASAQIPF